jgi:hypothetical protein
MGVPGGGDSVGWANLGDYLERIIDGLVAPVHHKSCIAHGGARGPSSAPAVTRKEARRRLTSACTPTPSLPSAPTDHKGVPSRRRGIETDQLLGFKHEGFWRPMDTLRDKQVLEDLVEQGKHALAARQGFLNGFAERQEEGRVRFLGLAASNEPLSVLCLGAHSHDIEIGAGATILCAAERLARAQDERVRATSVEGDPRRTQSRLRRANHAGRERNHHRIPNPLITLAWGWFFSDRLMGDLDEGSTRGCEPVNKTVHQSCLATPTRERRRQ